MSLIVTAHRRGDVPRPGRGARAQAASPPPACTAPTTASRRTTSSPAGATGTGAAKFRRLPIYVLIILALLALCQVFFAFAGVSAPFFHPFDGLRQIFPPDTLPQLALVFVQLPLLFFVNFAIFFGPFLFFARAADPRLRARRRQLGREDRRRPRPGRGQGGDHARDHPVAVGRGVREGRRQARARTAVPGRAGHRQDDDLQGHRHQLQLPVRDDPGSGFAGMFIGMDAITVQFLARKARKLAESGAASASCSSTRSTPSGMRRQALGQRA